MVQYYHFFNAVAAIIKYPNLGSVAVREQLGRLDASLCLWHTDLPHELHLNPTFSDSLDRVAFISGGALLLRQRVVLQLRYNFLRTVINYQLTMQSGQFADCSVTATWTTAEMCCATISLLALLRHEYPVLYRHQKAIFRHFLDKANSILADVAATSLCYPNVCSILSQGVTLAGQS